MQAELWTLSGLSVELGRDRRTLARDLEGLDPDKLEHKGGRTERRWRMRRVVEHLYRQGPSLAATDDFENQRERLAAAQAERVEMENAIRRGQLAECAAVQAGWADHIAAARAKLLSLPAKLGPQLTNISDASVAADKIRADIYAAIDELAEWELPETDDDGGGNAPADGERLEKPAAPDRERVGGRAPATV
jgi:phage terminase Nu1 subunit (DNA packaging protein)